MRIKKKNAIVFIVIITILAGAFYFMNINTSTRMSKAEIVVFETNQGDIDIEMFEDTPVTSGNFVKLVKSGYYDGIIFHRVIDGFMLQGGDPKGDGTGGPGYNIKDEFRTENRNDRGTISMANAGANTGGSQFFINLVNNNFLDDKHPTFGKVINGMDVVDKIAKVETDGNDKPVNDVIIKKAYVK